MSEPGCAGELIVTAELEAREGGKQEPEEEQPCPARGQLWRTGTHKIKQILTA